MGDDLPPNLHHLRPEAQRQQPQNQEAKEASGKDRQQQSGTKLISNAAAASTTALKGVGGGNMAGNISARNSCLSNEA